MGRWGRGASPRRPGCLEPGRPRPGGFCLFGGVGHVERRRAAPESKHLGLIRGQRLRGGRDPSINSG